MTALDDLIERGRNRLVPIDFDYESGKSELAQLRAERDALVEQVRTAHVIISHTVYSHPLYNNSDGVQYGCVHCEEKRAWLAANPSAPDAEQERTS